MTRSPLGLLRTDPGRRSLRGDLHDAHPRRPHRRRHADTPTAIGYIDPLPNDPLTLQGYLAPDLKDAIRAAFVELDDPAIIDLFRVERLAPATDADYDVLRDMRGSSGSTSR